MSDNSGGQFSGGDASHTPRGACEAAGLRDLLHRIAAHIAESDTRQESVLRDMQQRLTNLGEEAYAVRATVAPEVSAAVARIEDGLAALADRLGRPASTRTAQPPPIMEDDGLPDLFGRIQAATANAAAGLPPAGFRFHSRQETGDDGRDQGADAEWDAETAEALTQAYEASVKDAVDIQPPGAGCKTDNADRSAALHAIPSGASDLVESRLTRIADCLEQSVAALRSGSSVAALEARFDAFEQRVSAALAGAATHADVEGLRLVEANIAELTHDFHRAQVQLARLETVETHLTALAERMSDERLHKLLDRVSLPDAELERLAEAIAAQLDDRARARDGESGSLAMIRLDELRGLVERFVSSHRQDDEQTAGVLSTVQQAMVHLLDRMDALEQAHGAWPGSHAPQEPSREEPGDDPGALESVYHHQAPTARPASSQTPPNVAAPGGEARAADVGASAPLVGAIATELAEARAAAMKEATHTAAQKLPRETPLADSGEQTPQASGHPRPAPASREDLVAAARRAARQASSQSQLNSDTTRADMKPLRHRGAAGRKRGTLLGRTAGLLVFALIVALGIGVTTYSLFRSNAEPAGTERSLLLAPAGGSTSGADASERAASEEMDNAAVAPGSRASGSPDATDQSVESVVIDDQPTPGLPAPSILIDSQSGRSVAGLGVMLDTTTTKSADDIALQHHRRTLAQLSGRLGAAQASAVAVPTALLPNGGSAAADPQEAGRNQVQLLPPATIGPNSLRVAAANGDPSAEFEVAARLAEGKGVQQDFRQAAVWYQRSAMRGFAPAQYRLGTLYERGLGVKADKARAKAWYQSAAEKGNVKAMHNLAVLSASGSNGDYKTASHWFTEAAERGVRDSQFNLGVLLESGLGVEKDLKAAYKWFAIAAAAGDREAVKRRDQIRTQLGATDASDAEALLRAWRPMPVDPRVNDSRAAGEAWKRHDTGGSSG